MFFLSHLYAESVKVLEGPFQIIFSYFFNTNAAKDEVLLLSFEVLFNLLEETL